MALKWLRDNLKSLTWILWVVIFVFVALIFFGWGGINQQRQDTQDNVAATVGGEQVTYGEFAQQYRSLENFYRQTFGEQFNSELAKQLNLPVQALDQVINRKILLIEARKAGLRVSDQEVSQTILEYPIFKTEAGHFVGDQEYQRIIRRSLRQSVQEFEASVREELLLGKLNALLAKTAYVSDAEVEQAYRKDAEKAKIRFVHLPASEFIQQVTVEPAAVEAHFTAHRAEYEVPAQRVVQYIVVDAAEMRRQIDVPEADLKTYFDQHSDEFKVEEQVRARHILKRVTPDQPEAQAEAVLLAARKRIEAGEDFTALASQLSEDEGTASRGGDLGLFARGAMVKPFEDAAFAAPVGTLVGPIKTDFGYHLIRVEEHQTGGLEPFEKVRERIRARLLGERVDELAEAKIRDLAQRIEKDKLTSEEQLQKLAQEESLKLETTQPFGRNDVVPGIGRVQPFLKAAFELEAGKTSAPIKIPRGWAILALKETRAPRLPELSEVRTKVEADVKQERMKSASLLRLRELRQSNATLDAIAATLSLEVKDSEEFGRQGTIGILGRVPEVANAALSLEVGQLGGPFATTNGAVLFEVVERKKFDGAAFAAAKEQTRQRTESERLNQILASLIELRRKDLEPQYDPRLLKEFGIQGQEMG